MMMFSKSSHQYGGSEHRKVGRNTSPYRAGRTGRTAASVAVAAAASCGLATSAMEAADVSGDAQLVSATGTASGGGHAQGEGGGHGGGQSGGHGGGNSGGHGGGHGGHGGDGDAPDGCEFFLEHMWANEDGIPLLGSFSHLNEM